MSRNSEKANSVLFRYQEQKAQADGGYIDYNSTARPRAINKVTSLKDAENWRKQVLKDINQKITKIQDEHLSNYQIRDLNDEINKLMKEKYSWEYHIKNGLGGSDYLSSNNRDFQQGVLIGGYRYFGRAKDLPGVKEILAKQQKDKEDRKNKQESDKSGKLRLKELMDRVSDDSLLYYGYHDEKNKNVKNLKKEIWEEVSEILGDDLQLDDDKDNEDEDGVKAVDDELLKFERSSMRKRIKKMKQDESMDVPHVLIIDEDEPPSQQQVEAYLVQQRRAKLSEKYNI